MPLQHYFGFPNMIPEGVFCPPDPPGSTPGVFYRCVLIWKTDQLSHLRSRYRILGNFRGLIILKFFANKFLGWPSRQEMVTCSYFNFRGLKL